MAFLDLGNRDKPNIDGDGDADGVFDAEVIDAAADVTLDAAADGTLDAAAETDADGDNSFEFI